MRVYTNLKLAAALIVHDTMGGDFEAMLRPAPISIEQLLCGVAKDVLVAVHTRRLEVAGEVLEVIKLVREGMLAMADAPPVTLDDLVREAQKAGLTLGADILAEAAAQRK